MNSKITRILTAFSFLILCTVFSYEYLSLNLWDYDFWWHAATGRYIMENGHLPEKDPFSYTAGLEENKNPLPERESFILKQYWLGQIIFFSIYKTFNDQGIIIFRALLFLLTAATVLWRLRRNGVSFYVCYLSLFLVCSTLLSFTAERPVLFTNLFSVLVFSLLEEYRTRRGGAIFLLPPLMLLWANMHGGFILGIAIIAAFLVGEGLGIMLKLTTYTKKELSVFYGVSLLAISLSALNPNGFSAFLLTVSAKHRIFMEGIEEYVPTFSLYRDKLRQIDTAYITLVVLLPILGALRIRKMNISHIIVLLGLFAMSVAAFRFVVYFVLIGTVILATELNALMTSFSSAVGLVNRQRLTHAFTILMLLCSIALFANVKDFGGLRYRKAISTSVPESAVDFIKNNHLEGNIYNDFVFGGYITWRLYPWKKTFIDTRSLNATVLSEAAWIYYARESLTDKPLSEGKSPLWEKLLDHYQVDIVMLDTLNVHGVLAPLVLKLLDSKTWVPLYADSLSVVFVRQAPNNRATIENHRIEEGAVFSEIIERAKRGALMNRNNSNFLVSLGDILSRIGHTDDALRAYEFAAQRSPDDRTLTTKIEELKKKIY